MPKFISVICRDFNKRILALILISLTFNILGQDTLTVEQLDYRFITIDESGISPLTSFESTDVAGVFVPCDEKTTIAFCGPVSFSIWVDGRFIELKESGDCIYKEVEVLCDKSERDTVFVSLVSRDDLQSATVRTIEVKNIEEDAIQPETRFINKGSGLIAVISCAFLILGLARYSPIRVISLLKINLSNYSDRATSPGNLIQLLGIIFLGAFLWTFVNKMDPSEFIEALGMLAIFWVLRGILILLSGELFNLRKLALWQLVFSIQYWLLACIFLFGLLIANRFFLGFAQDQMMVMVFCLTGGLLGFLVIVAVASTSSGVASSLHRFIYLCTTEILPTVYVIQIFLK